MNVAHSLLAVLLAVLWQTPVLAQQPVSPLVDSFKSYQQMKRETVFGLPWIGIGPVVNSARVESVQLDPTRPGTMYVAFGSGNLWKTDNNGVNWKPLFEDQPSHGIGDIALAPSNPDIIYLGTGESLKKARNFTIPGTGVYRSDDGGEHWRHLGLSDSWHIGEIAVHPDNPDVAIVAVLGHFWSSNPNRGLYRTADGGKSWEHVLAIDQNTGGNDVVWGQNDSNVVYASTWENYPDVAGKNSAVHVSRDMGKTWKKCESGLPTHDLVGRIGLAVSHQDANKAYAFIDDRQNITQGSGHVYQSLDGGENWTRTHESGLMILSRIGWYFADIYVNPQNDDEVYALGVRVAHSIDGGKSFDLLGGTVAHVNPSAASGLHLDHCELWIHPTNPNHLVLGNDGGLYQSFDKGNSWLHFNNLPTGEFYDIAVDQGSPYRIFAGAQDDATVYGPAKPWDPTRPDLWKYLWIDPWNGGDGCITQVDPNDPNTVYFSAQEGAFRRKDMTTNRSQGIRPKLPRDHDGELDFNFVAPMIISPHDSNTLYLAGNYMFRSRNRGNDWSVISPNLAKSKQKNRDSVAVSAIAQSPHESDLIYAGTDKGAIWVTEDEGATWVERCDGLPIGYVRSICASVHAPSRAYVAASGLNYDDFNTHLLCTEDCGETWKSISANLPGEPANVVLEDPIHENMLYAGLFRGVYLSLDRGKSWSLLGGNLPNCSVADLAIQEQEKDLIIGTHGRGIYKMDLKPLYEFVECQSEISGGNYLFPIPSAKRPYLSDIRPGPNFRGFEETPITFWLTEAGNVQLSVFKKPRQSNPQPEEQPAPNEAPNEVVSFSISGRKGMNQFRWDLVTKNNQSDAPYFINYREHLAAGSYRVRIESANGDVAQRDWIVEQ